MLGEIAKRPLRLRRSIERLFRPREIIVRSEGRVHCLVLSTRWQARVAGALAVAAAWTLWSTAGTIVGLYRSDGADSELYRAKAAYVQLLGDVEESQRLLEDMAQGLAAGEGGTDGAESGAGGAAGAEALKARLAAFEDRLHDVISLNRTLRGELAVVHEKLEQAEREEDDRTALAVQLATADKEIVSLRRRVGGLAGQLAVAERTEDALLSAAGMVRGASAAGGSSVANAVGYPLSKLFAGDGPEDALVIAVMQQESAFDPTAVSVKGARGLMQLMPDTARQVAKKLKLEFDKSTRVDSTDINIALGRAYLDELLNLFDRSYVLAIAAYNAGPQRVLEWMREFGDPRDNGVNVAKWVASIPYAETRDYVRRVTKSLEQYRRRLALLTRDRCFSLENVSY